MLAAFDILIYITYYIKYVHNIKMSSLTKFKST